MALNRRCLVVIFALQLLSTVAISIVFSLLTVYLLFHLHWLARDSYDFVAAYNALSYAVAVFGGVLAERWLGQRLAVVVSSLLGSVGLILMATSASWGLRLGLALLCVAYGILLPTLLVLLGRIQALREQARREQGFMLAYMVMDVGAFFAALVASLMSVHFGYHVAFYFAAGCHSLGLILFWWIRRDLDSWWVPRSVSITSVGLLLTLALLMLTVLLLDHARFCNALLMGLGASCAGVMLYTCFQQRGRARGKFLVFIILLFVSTLFDLSYFFNVSILTVFTEMEVGRQFLGVELPTATYSALNPLFVVMLGPAMGRAFVRFKGPLGLDSLAYRFAWGMCLLGLGYWILMLGVRWAAPTGGVHTGWLIAGYLLQTLGELLISPSAYAMVGLLVPAALEGLMMGICQFSTGVAGAMSGFMANWVTPPGLGNHLADQHWYQHTFACLGLVAFCLALILMVVAPWLNRLAQGETNWVGTELY
jgi:POT family proton-dependent oligopeptide transporter